MKLRAALTCAVMALLSLPALALANARLISVVALDGGCVSGPRGNAVQAWDVQPGRTYELTLGGVTECANGGADPTLGVRVNSSATGNTDVVATRVSAGVYKFSFTLPVNGVCTFPIRYCTTPGRASTGLVVQRNDGGAFQAHLRAATFGPACTNASSIVGADCKAVPTLTRSWGQVKFIYR